MREVLTKLKQCGFKLYGLTNWSSTVYPVMQRFEIFNLLDGQIISSEEHLLKPEPAIYHRLFEKFGLKAEECIFADDRTENIEGAKAVGMDGIVFKNAQQYVKELKQRLPQLNL